MSDYPKFDTALTRLPSAGWDRKDTPMYPYHLPHDARDRPGDDQDALRPDPLFMACRSLVTSGPIGFLARRVEHWLMLREDRRLGLSVGDALSLGDSLHREVPLPALVAIDSRVSSASHVVVGQRHG